ncbi:MAG: YhbY family RNA-binding protein [Candidatus Woesearchaeota archaeon]
MTLQIGKKGLTKSVLEEIAYQLKEKKAIKVKMLQSITKNMKRDEINEALQTITEYINAKGLKTIIDKRIGNTAIIRLEKKR